MLKIKLGSRFDEQYGATVLVDLNTDTILFVVAEQAVDANISITDLAQQIVMNVPYEMDVMEEESVKDDGERGWSYPIFPYADGDNE